MKNAILTTLGAFAATFVLYLMIEYPNPVVIKKAATEYAMIKICLAILGYGPLIFEIVDTLRNKPKIMKIFILVFITGFSLQSKAQDSTLKVRVGILLAPMASVSLQEPKLGFTGSVPLFGTVAFIKGKTLICPSYCFNANSVNLFISNDVTPKISPYIVTMYGVTSRWTYTGIGITTPVMEGKASIFAEIGSNWGKLQPLLYLGTYIPLDFKIH